MEEARLGLQQQGLKQNMLAFRKQSELRANMPNTKLQESLNTNQLGTTETTTNETISARSKTEQEALKDKHTHIKSTHTHATIKHKSVGGTKQN